MHPLKSIRSLAFLVGLASALAVSQSVARPTAHAQSATPTPPAPLTTCQIDGVAARDVTMIDPAMIVADPHDTTWHVPTRVAWVAERATPHRDAMLLFGGPRHHCRAMGSDTFTAGPHGPFNGFADSNDHWTSRIFCGERCVATIIDEHRQLRAIHDLQIEWPTDEDAVDAAEGIRAIALFPDGISLLATMVQGSWGAVHVLTVINGRLEEVYGQAWPDGVVLTAVLQPGVPPSATPTLTLTRRHGGRHPGTTTTEMHWNATTHRFE